MAANRIRGEDDIFRQHRLPPGLRPIWGHKGSSECINACSTKVQQLYASCDCIQLLPASCSMPWRRLQHPADRRPRCNAGHKT
jgi:hypothetical protein